MYVITQPNETDLGLGGGDSGFVAAACSQGNLILEFKPNAVFLELWGDILPTVKKVGGKILPHLF